MPHCGLSYTMHQLYLVFEHMPHTTGQAPACVVQVNQIFSVSSQCMHTCMTAVILVYKTFHCLTLGHLVPGREALPGYDPVAQRQQAASGRRTGSGMLTGTTSSLQHLQLHSCAHCCPKLQWAAASLHT